jgi:inner membrane protein
MVIFWGWRWAEHAQGLAMLNNTQVSEQPMKRVALEPYPVNPWRWHAVMEMADRYQMAELNTRTGEIESDPRVDVLFKPPVTAATDAAKRTSLGKAYMDWGTWAVVEDVGQEPITGLAPPELPLNRRWTTVEFSDLRFRYDFLGVGRTPKNDALTGRVYIVDGREDGGEVLNGRVQR